MNRRHKDFQSSALPPELPWHKKYDRQRILLIGDFKKYFMKVNGTRSYFVCQQKMLIFELAKNLFLNDSNKLRERWFMIIAAEMPLVGEFIVFCA